uniref:UPAR/Ly6 domain-containing protein qvr n=1 Tax=Syphacia muris TaxID=451379 RepID=A0A0N5AKK9_9BILA
MFFCLLFFQIAFGQITSIRCYSCTTMDADQLLNDVQDPNWRRWLENLRYVPQTEHCNDYFRVIPELALRSGVKSQECDNGVCMKMWFKEKQGKSQVWRSCIPNGKLQIRADCTRISSSLGDLEVCTCDSNLCNSFTPLKPSFTTLFIYFLCIILFARL